MSTSIQAIDQATEQSASIKWDASIKTDPTQSFYDQVVQYHRMTQAMLSQTSFMINGTEALIRGSEAHENEGSGYVYEHSEQDYAQVDILTELTAWMIVMRDALERYIDQEKGGA